MASETEFLLIYHKMGKIERKQKLCLWIAVTDSDDGSGGDDETVVVLFVNIKNTVSGAFI